MKVGGVASSASSPQFCTPNSLINKDFLHVGLKALLSNSLTVFPIKFSSVTHLLKLPSQEVLDAHGLFVNSLRYKGIDIVQVTNAYENLHSQVERSRIPYQDITTLTRCGYEWLGELDRLKGVTFESIEADQLLNVKCRTAFSAYSKQPLFSQREPKEVFFLNARVRDAAFWSWQNDLEPGGSHCIITTQNQLEWLAKKLDSVELLDQIELVVRISDHRLTPQTWLTLLELVQRSDSIYFQLNISELVFKNLGISQPELVILLQNLYRFRVFPKKLDIQVSPDLVSSQDFTKAIRHLSFPGLRTLRLSGCRYLSIVNLNLALIDLTGVEIASFFNQERQGINVSLVHNTALRNKAAQRFIYYGSAWPMSIDFTGCPINERAVCRLEQVKSIKDVNFTQTQVAPRVLAGFAIANPNATVLYDERWTCRASALQDGIGADFVVTCGMVSKPVQRSILGQVIQIQPEQKSLQLNPKFVAILDSLLFWSYTGILPVMQLDQQLLLLDFALEYRIASLRDFLIRKVGLNLCVAVLEQVAEFARHRRIDALLYACHYFANTPHRAVQENLVSRLPEHGLLRPAAIPLKVVTNPIVLNCADNLNVTGVDRAVLAAASDYFRVLFYDRWRETNVVDLSSWPKYAVNCLVEYLYGRSVNLPKTAERVLEVAKLANYMQAYGLVGICRNVLQEEYEGPDPHAAVCKEMSSVGIDVPNLG